ncbi:MAG: response regulator transcription factor [Nitrososphaeraceae archaeon]|jgi:DNA-binding response OmpR family regulator
MTKKRVLIIDDEKDVGNLFKIYLEKSGEYQIDVYTDPVDALYYFKKGLYDLVLLDLKMPQIDGISMYQQLKKVDSNTSICLITADIANLEQLKTKIPNIEKYVIYKPTLLRNLKDKIDSLLLEKNMF